MCITPTVIKSQYTTSSLDHTKTFPCGKCIECQGERQSQWIFRLQEEQKCSKSAQFVTLTYADEPRSFNGHGTLDPKDLKNFWKALRKQNKGKIKYFACGEYGEQEKRPHYHAIVYNLDRKFIRNNEHLAQAVWKHGHVDIAPATGGTMRYCTKYMTQDKWEPEQDDDDRHRPFQRQSQGLGKYYINESTTAYYQNTLTPYVQIGKTKLKLPRYYKEKMLNRQQKHLMASKSRQYQKENFNLDEYLEEDAYLTHQKISHKIEKSIRQQHANKKTYKKDTNNSL